MSLRDLRRMIQMIKPKPKLCPYCKEEYTPFNSLNPCHLNPTCATQWLKDNPEKAKKNYKKVVRKELNQMKEKGISHDAWQAKLQPFINKIARLIDAGCGCVSCPNELINGQARYGSHRWNVGNNNTWRFNLNNIWTSCFKCNSKLSGNGDGYDKGLEQTYGKEYAEYVKFGMKLQYPIIKLTIDEIKEAIVKAKEVIKELETLDKTYTPQERIELRHKYNKQIGIYL